jgi:putative tryptophan/tyrosine transport system substrate-binding protein
MTEPPSPLRMLLSRHTKRREFIALLGGAAAWPLAARAQQPQHRHFRIGWLVFGGAALGVVDRTLLDALKERGLIDARNIELIFRYANGVPTQLGDLALLWQIFERCGIPESVFQ